MGIRNLMHHWNSCRWLLLSAILIAATARCAPTNTNTAINDALTAKPSAATASAKGAPTKMTIEGMEAYNSGDRIRAFRYLRQAADAGDPEAQVNLGYLYARGHGTMVNQEEALRLYELSAKAGSSEGMNAIGFKYLHASGVSKDSVRAVYWFCGAVRRGNPRAMNNLAIMLVSGESPFDEEEARSLWQQAAALGHANAMNNLGHSYIDGRSRDAQKADEWMTRAAQAGHAGAQRYLVSRGYADALPPAIDWSLRMTPAPTNVTGQSKTCGADIP